VIKHGVAVNGSVPFSKPMITSTFFSKSSLFASSRNFVSMFSTVMISPFINDYLLSDYAIFLISLLAGPSALIFSVAPLMTCAHRSPSDAETQVNMVLSPSTPM
jgi:hypothetical protein